MREVFLGIGSNLGPSKEVVGEALKKIAALNFVYTLEKSPTYQTSPVSNIPQNDYINLVCSLFTDCKDPHLFLKELQKIEKELGKTHKPKDAPRVIDIDILLYGDTCVSETELEIPHPRMLGRLFVLEPLSHFKKKLYYPVANGDYVTIDLKKEINKIHSLDNQVVKKIF